MKYNSLSKPLSKSSIENTHLNTIKAIDDNTTSIIFEWQNAASISIKISNQTGMPALTINIYYNYKVLDREIRPEKEIKLS